MGALSWNVENISFCICSETCPHLSITEEKQNFLKKTQSLNVTHKCLKYDTRLYHLYKHPKLYKCKDCLNDEILL